MKARDIQVGDVVNGLWTVTDVFEVCGIAERQISDRDAMGRQAAVTRSADPWDSLVHLKLERGIPDPATRRTWYRADEEVEVSRES